MNKLLLTMFFYFPLIINPQEISFSVNNPSLEIIILEVESQADLKFAYGDDVDLSTKLLGRFSFEKEKLDKVLEEITRRTPYTLRIIGNNIAISVDLPIEKSKNKTTKIQEIIKGKVTDSNGMPLPSVTIQEEGTNNGVLTDFDGNFTIEVKSDDAVLVFTYIGMEPARIPVRGQTTINVEMKEDSQALEEVVVVGYGVQKKSDITGSVSSVSKERLEMVPNTTIAQAIQGAIPGAMVQNTSAGAEPSLDIMVRGRNSIGANNSPLIVVDGIPYGGNLSDINPNDVESIEVLKDASAAAIYGSRGSNGVILVTTKQGIEGPPTLSYDGYFSIQEFTNMPEYMDGPQFYNFKNERLSAGVTASEQAVYDAGEWVNWEDLAFRQGFSQQHNLSVSGGSTNTSYFVSGAVMDVQGITINDNYFRSTGRLNLDTKISDLLTIGTRTQLTFSDKSGVAPSMFDTYLMNPLAVPYNEDGTLTINPVADDPARGNPLQTILFEDTDKSRQIVTNIFAIVDFEQYVPGLNFRFNYGITDRVSENNTYRGRDTYDGLISQGNASISKSNDFNTVLENILSYNTEFGDHSLSATAVYSWQKDVWNSDNKEMAGFPNDLLSWYAGGQAELIQPSFDYVESQLISQMLRVNYAYDSRYLLTLTGRRDGYSGFGADEKYGIFPSVALGWNFANEEFFPWQSLFSELKLRASYGINGNQAVGSYQSMGRLEEENMLSGNTTMPGYFPSTLGQQTLGWESSRSMNFGLDFGILKNRFSGGLNVYKTETYDLLLNRAISSVHGITSIVQNIGETNNKGIEFSLHSRNIVERDFNWTTMGNISYVSNKIVDLYGNGQDDVGNMWFIGEPIRVNYDYVFDGVWQLDEETEAAQWGSQPGYIKIKDVDGDGQITTGDRQIIGQQDPNLLWGMTNTFTYGNFDLSVFIHGVHGVTKENILMDDDIVTSGVRRNTIVKNWWTPENPSNEWYMNDVDADRMAGITTSIYENASFVRLKDITLSYDVPLKLIQNFGAKKFRVYATGRNLLTLTKWSGLDPELNEQRGIPLQQELVLGLQVGL